MFRLSQRGRDLGVIAVVAGLYFALAALGYEFTRRGERLSVLWPVAGFGIAVLLGGGWRMAAGLCLGALGNALLHFPLLPSIGIMLGAVASSACGAGLCRRVMATTRLDWVGNQRENLAYVAAAMLASSVSMAVAGSVFWLSGFMSPEQLGRSALVWWSGDVLGVLLFLPFFLSVRSYYRGGGGEVGLSKEILPGALYLVLIVAVVAAIFTGLIAGPVLILFFLLFLVVNAIWGCEWVKLTAVLVALAMVLAGKYGGPPAQIVSFTGPLPWLQLQLGLLALTALLISSLGRLRLLGLPSLILVMGWGASSLVYFSLAHKQQEAELTEMNQLVRGIEEEIKDRLQTYGDILRSASAMIQITGFVDRPTWRTYVNSLQVFQRYPGVHGLGVVYPVRAAETDQFLRFCREQGMPPFAIHPVPNVTPPPADDAGYDHFVVGLIEPQEGNQDTIGLDAASEARRQEAAMHARDTGEMHATLSVRLLQLNRPGFLVFCPVFRKDRPLTTVAERREAFLCWVYAPFVMEEVFGALPGSANPKIEFSIYEDSAMAPANLLYRSHRGATGPRKGSFDRVTRMTIFQVDYYVGWRSLQVEAPLAHLPAVLGAGGIILASALLAGLVLSLQGFATRASQLADQRTAELNLSNRQLMDSNLALSDAQRRMSLKDQEARKLALLAARTVNAVLLTNTSRVIEWVNDAFTRMTGFSMEEAIGRTPGELVFEGNPDPEILAGFEAGMATGQGFVIELRCFTKQLRDLWISLEVQPLIDAEGRLIGYMYIATNITERRNHEAQLEQSRASAEAANQAKTAFLGNISHELRTPLNVIQGNVGFVLDERFGPVNERQAGALRNAQENSAHLLALINDLLDITKAESGRIQLVFEPVGVRQLCAESLQVLGDSMTRKGLRLIQDYRHATDVIGADGLRLKQILVNLLSNAVKFTPAGGSITLRVEETASPPQLLFHVIDTGLGLKREDHERIFLEFEQANSLVHQAGSGTGLGLPIARRFAQLHGGSLTLSSTPGQGCCFTVCIPVRPVSVADAPRQVSIVSASPMAPFIPADRLILVVEDYPANLELLVSFLDGDGYRVASAVNGFEAVELALAQRPDLILMDVKMPGMDGLEATRRLRADPRTRDIPVISLTAFASDSDAQACYDAGATGYVTKPIDFARLSRLILHFLRSGPRPAVDSHSPVSR